MNDSDLTGDALLKRLDELTGHDQRDPSGGNGWRHLLFAAKHYIEWQRAQLLDLRYERNELEDEVAALEDELREARDD